MQHGKSINSSLRAINMGRISKNNIISTTPVLHKTLFFSLKINKHLHNCTPKILPMFDLPINNIFSKSKLRSECRWTLIITSETTFATTATTFSYIFHICSRFLLCLCCFGMPSPFLICC